MRLVMLVPALGLTSCSLVWGLPEQHLDPHLVCQDGTCQCTAGYAICDGNEAEGCQISLADDAQNCGACGHDCLGGACQDALCQPVTVLDYSALAVSSFALGDDGYLYAGGCSPALLRAPVGGAPDASYTVVMDTWSSCLWGIAIADDVLYFRGDDAIAHVSLGAPAAPIRLVRGANAVGSVVAGGGYIYWQNFTGIYRTATDHPEEETVQPGLFNIVLADNARIYWTDSTAIYWLPHAFVRGQAPESITVESGANSLGLQGSMLYWSTFDETIYRLPLQDGVPAGPQTVVASAHQLAALVVDATHVYWLDDMDKGLYRAPVGGGAPEQLLSGLSFDFAMPWLAIDAQAVYFTDGQRIARVAK